MTIQFSVPGQPIPKGRPRVLRSGITYTPKYTREHEKAIRAYARGAFGFSKADPKSHFELSATFYMRGNRKADLDNLLKCVMDGITGAIWEDDSQVRSFKGVSIFYGGINPFTTIIVSTMEDP